VTSFPQGVACSCRQVLVQLEAHHADSRKWQQPLAGKVRGIGNGSLMSFGCKPGYSTRISSLDRPAARLSRTTATGMRVPLMQAWPWQDHRVGRDAITQVQVFLIPHESHFVTPHAQSTTLSAEPEGSMGDEKRPLAACAPMWSGLGRGGGACDVEWAEWAVNHGPTWTDLARDRSRLMATPHGGVTVGPVLAPAIEKLPEAIARLVAGLTRCASSSSALTLVAKRVPTATSTCSSWCRTWATSARRP